MRMPKSLWIVVLIIVLFSTTTVAAQRTPTPSPTPPPLPTGIANNYSVTVEGYEDPVREPSHSYDPWAGHHLVAFHVVLENLDNEETLSTSVSNGVLVDAEGFVYDSESSLCKHEISGANLVIGEKRRGRLCFVIPNDALPVNLKFKYADYPEQFVEVKLPDKLPPVELGEDPESAQLKELMHSPEADLVFGVLLDVFSEDALIAILSTEIDDAEFLRKSLIRPLKRALS